MTKLATPVGAPALRGHGYERANTCQGCEGTLRATSNKDCGEPGHYHMGIDSNGMPAAACCKCAAEAVTLIARSPLEYPDYEDDTATEGGDTSMARKTKTEAAPVKEADARTNALVKALKKEKTKTASVADLAIAGGMSYNAAKRRLEDHPELFTKVGRKEGWTLADTNGATPTPAAADEAPEADASPEADIDELLADAGNETEAGEA